MYPSLRAFLNALESAGELHRVTCPVNPVLEVAEIAHRVARMKAPRASAAAAAFDPAMAGMGGRALLLDCVEGCDFPLAINVYGSYARMEMALGCDAHAARGGHAGSAAGAEGAGGSRASAGGFTAIAARLESLLKPAPPQSMRDAFAKARELAPLLRIGPRRVRRGACQEVIKLSALGQVDLNRLPLIKCWPLDGLPNEVGYAMTAQQAGTAGGGGRYITLAGMHTIHAEDRHAARPASHNIGMYRAQLLGPTRLAMHWHMHHDGAAHWRSWKAIGQPMPIAICLGGESVMPYGATAPLPPGVSELLMCGFLNGAGIPMVRAATVPLWVPANSEIVIEGWVSTECGGVGWEPGDEPLGPGAVFEGPFGDHTGFYSLPDRYPVVEVTALTHRRDAVYPTTIVGLPPQEDYYLGKATERIFLPLLRTLVPDIQDYHLPQFGCFHNAAFIRVHKAYPLQARRVMSSVWGAGQMAWTKMIFVFDENAPIHDEAAALRTIFARCNFLRDTMAVQGPLDILDHAAPWLGAGTKLGFDCTRKITGEAWNGAPLDDPRLPEAHEIDQTRARVLQACATAPGAHTGAAHGELTCAFPAAGLGRLCVLRVPSTDGREHAEGETLAQRMMKAALEALPEPSGAADFLVVVDHPIEPEDWSSALFLLASNADPGRDLMRRGARLAFDATRKTARGAGGASGDLPTRRFPPILAMDEVTRALVDRRWREYGFTEPPPARQGLDR